MKDINFIKQKIVSCLKTDKAIAAVYVFGSYAKQSPRHGSDIDIAILLAQFDRSQSADVKIKYSLLIEELLGHPIDIVLLNSANCILKNQVYKYGVSILDNKPIISKRFMANSMIEYIDFLPLRNIMSKGMERRYARGGD